MRNVIRVQPALELRREFAQWAVGHDPKLVMVGSHEFGVPPGVYIHMPEELLIGSLVEGTPYVPALDDDASEPQAAAVEFASGGVVSATLLVGESGPEDPFPTKADRAAALAEASGLATLLDRPPLDPDLTSAHTAAVSPLEQEPAESGEPDADTPEGTQGEHRPTAPDSARAPDAAPILPPLDENGGRQNDRHTGSFACVAAGCHRTFGTSRGRDAHTRQVHPELRTES